jgi:O-antigen ligase
VIRSSATVPGSHRHVLSWLVLPGALATAWLLGPRLVGPDGGPSQPVTALVAVAVGCTLWQWFARVIPVGVLAVEVPLALLLASTLVFRTRSVQEIGYNPLDPAAQFRVACLGVAGVLAGAALITRPAPDVRRVTTVPFQIYGAYVGVVLLGAFLSVRVIWTLYRGAELVIAMVALAGAHRAVGADAARRIEHLLFGWVVAMVASIWIGAAVVPGQAFEHLRREDAPLRWELTGVFPTFSANFVGTLGVVLATWSLARVASGRLTRPSRRVHLALAAVGVVTLALAQYRTGYVALVVAVVVLLVLTRQYPAMLLVAMVALGVFVTAPSLVTGAEPHLLRGQSPEEARELSSRVDWWNLALPVWRESPIIGRGLLTATRVEVLEPAGFGGVSSIHSTWVEALVGTGVVGVGLLAMYVLSLGTRALARARGPDGDVAPFLLLVVVLVRSATGKTFEALGFECLLMLSLALALALPTPHVTVRGGSSARPDRGAGHALRQGTR